MADEEMVQQFKDWQSTVRAAAATSTDFDPDKAAYAYQLEQATGVPSQAIFGDGDPDEFAARERRTTAADIASSDPYIGGYLLSHPMAAKISNDDLVNLKDLSDKMQSFTGKKTATPIGAAARAAERGVVPMIGSFPAIGAGAEAGAAIGAALPIPGATIAGGLIGGVIGGLGGSYAISLAQDWLLSKLPDSLLEVIGQDKEQQRADMVNQPTATFLGGLAPFALGMRPGIVAGKELPAAASSIQKIMNHPVTAHLLSGAALGGLEAGQEAALQGKVDWAHVGYSTAFGTVFAKPTTLGKALTAKGASEAQRFISTVSLYRKAGKEPIVGVDPNVDAVKKDEAKDRLKALDDLVDSYSKTNTAQRSPDHGQAFAEQFPNQSIEIDADAVKQVYGEKSFSDPDGKLSWIPNLQEQMDVAETHNGKVEVPLTLWLRNMADEANKDLFEQLHDSITPTKGSLSKNEADALPKPEVDEQFALPIGDPTQQAIETVRKAAEVEPLILTTRLSLVRREAPEGEHHFDMMRMGEKVGTFEGHEEKFGEVIGKRKEEYLNLDPDLKPDDKLLYVDVIEAEGAKTVEEGAGKIGVAGIRSLASEIKREFPDVTAVVGDHIAGVEGAKVFRIRKAGEPLEAPPEPTGKPTTKAQQLELDVTRMEDKDVFENAKALGMNAKEYKAQLKEIAKQRTEEQEAQFRRAQELVRRQMRPEWKEKEAAVRAEVAEKLSKRPDILADDFLRHGILQGDKLPKIRKIGKNNLTPEQSRRLPEQYQAKEGMHPDDVATLFGYPSGDVMIDHLAAFDKAKGITRLIDFKRKLIKDETNRLMTERYGDFEKNVLAEAEEHVTDEGQLGQLHNEVLALATRAGMKIVLGPKGPEIVRADDAQLPITREQLEGWVREKFMSAPYTSHSFDKYVTSSGKAWRKVAAEHLFDDHIEALKARQAQQMAMLFAKYAKQLEKIEAKFKKNTKRMSAREVNGIDIHYTNFIHSIMMRFGIGVKRSVQDLADAIQRSGYKTLEDFVIDKQDNHMPLEVASFLMDPDFKGRLENLSTEDFYRLHYSIESLIKNGRDEKTVVSAGDKADLDEKSQEAADEMDDFALKKIDMKNTKTSKVMKAVKTYGAAHLQIEALFRRFDRGDPNGVWTRWILRPLIEAAYASRDMEKIYSRKLAAIADGVNLKEKIENNLFRHPLEGYAFDLNRKNLRAIMQYVGSKSGMEKLAGGYDIEPAQVMDWLNQHAKKEDWDYVQALGDIMAELKQEADKRYELASMVPGENIEINPVVTKFGVYKGWYNRVIYDHRLPQKSKRLRGSDDLMDPQYLTASTANSYMKKRTGYIGPVSLDLDATPFTIKQIIHDMNMREAVANTGKFFRHNKIKQAIINHYGEVYEKLLDPFLRDVAGAANYRSDAQRIGTQWLEFARQNIISTLIGFNPGTVLKHGPTAAMNSITEVGPINFAKAFISMFSNHEGTSDSNWNFAMENSRELPNRVRNYQETITGGYQEVLGEKSWRRMMIKLAATPVAWSDLMSAVPTWLAQYEKSMLEHGVQGDAIFEADRAVRNAHGSMITTNRPAIMRTGPMGQWLASLYGFFSHILNRQYELAWRSKDTLSLAMQGELAEAGKNLPRLGVMLFSYVIAPALIEEMVSPATNKEKKSWGHKAAEVLARGLTSSWIGIRDLTYAIEEGRDPTMGLMSTAAKDATDLIRDLKRDHAFSKEHRGSLISHGVTAFGALTGLANAQEGKVMEYLYNYYEGRERPRNLWQTGAGLRYGRTKGHSGTPEKWFRHIRGEK